MTSFERPPVPYNPEDDEGKVIETPESEPKPVEDFSEAEEIDFVEVEKPKKESIENEFDGVVIEGSYEPLSENESFLGTAFNPEVQEEVEQTSHAERVATDLEETQESLIKESPERENEIAEAVATAKETAATKEQDLEIARLKAEIDTFNKAVQEGKVSELQGSEFFVGSENNGIDFVERNVVSREERIRELENEKIEVGKKEEHLHSRLEIDRLKREIDDLNEAVQKGEFITKYGTEFGFNKAEGEAYVDRRVQENEDKIRELEAELRGETAEQVPAVVEEPLEGEVEDAFEKESDTSIPEELEAELRGETAEQVPAVVEEPLEGEVEDAFEKESDTSIPEELEGEFVEAYAAQAEKGSVWGWVKERAKGMATFGFWEFRQAERFRSARNDVAARLERAGKILGGFEFVNKKSESPFLDFVENTNEQTKLRKEGNDAYIDSVVATTVAALTERLAKYKNESGVDVVSDETVIANLEKNVRESLTNMQEGQVALDEKDFRKVVQENLDPSFWRRYIYGALESVLALWGIKTAVSHVAATKWWAGKKAGDIVAEVAQQKLEDVISESTEAVAAATELQGEVPMNNTIWQTASELLAQNGVENPSDAEIMEVSKQMAIDNGIGVEEWGIPGDPMDTKMEQGHLLDVNGATKKILLGIKVVRGISSLI